MFGNVKSLELLCIKVISTRIHQIKGFFKEEDNIQFQFPSTVGDALFYDYLSNSGENGVEEECLKFILNRCRVRNFHIYPRKFYRIEYFDFLNGQEFDELYIYGQSHMKIKKYRYFSLKVKVLNLYRTPIYKWNRQFFSKCNVTDNLICNGGIYNDELPIDNIYELIEYSSPDLSKIFIKNSYISKRAMNKFKRALKKKKKLKDVFPCFEIDQFGFQCKFRTSIIRDGLLPSSTNITSIGFEFVSNDVWDYRIGNELFKSLTNLQELQFSIRKYNDNYNDVINFFDILLDQQSKTLKKIDLYVEMTSFKVKLRNFLLNCKLLEEVKIHKMYFDSHGEIDYEIFDALLPSAKNLKLINIHPYNTLNRSNYESVKKLLSLSRLRHFYINKWTFNNDTLKGLFKNLENSKISLHSFSISDCEVNNEEIETIANFSSELRNLKNFLFEKITLDEDKLYILSNGLEKISEHLEILHITQPNHKEDIDGLELIGTIVNCKNLQYLKLNGLDFNSCFHEFLSSISQLQNVIEKLTLGMLINNDNTPTFFDLLTRLQRLEHLKFEADSITKEYGKKFTKFLEENKCQLKYLVPMFDNRNTCEFTPEFFNDFPRLQLLSTFFDIDEFDYFPYHFHNLYEDTDG